MKCISSSHNRARGRKLWLYQSCTLTPALLERLRWKSFTSSYFSGLFNIAPPALHRERSVSVCARQLHTHTHQIYPRRENHWDIWINLNCSGRFSSGFRLHYLTRTKILGDTRINPRDLSLLWDPRISLWVFFFICHSYLLYWTDLILLFFSWFCTETGSFCY